MRRSMVVSIKLKKVLIILLIRPQLKWIQWLRVKWQRVQLAQLSQATQDLENQLEEITYKFQLRANHWLTKIIMDQQAVKPFIKNLKPTNSNKSKEC